MAQAIEQMRRTLPFEDWPATDRQAWAIAMAQGDILDGRGPAAHWAAATKQTNERHYGRWLGYWSWRGRLDGSAIPGERVTPEAIRQYSRHLQEIVAPRTRLSMLVGLKVMIQAMAPDQDWRWLQDVCNRVQRIARPRRDKLARMRPSSEIFAAAIEEMRNSANKSGLLKAAVVFRDGFMLAVLASRPLRLRNFTQIELGRHLMPMNEHWLLAFSGAETKTHQPIEFFLPEELEPYLDIYLEQIRPLFPGADETSRLWLGLNGPPLCPQSVYLRITKLTKRLFGAPINPHLLRDCAATSLALVSSDAARAAAPLLGHRRFSTTEKYYVQAVNLEASRKLNAILASVKASLETEE